MFSDKPRLLATHKHQMPAFATVAPVVPLTFALGIAGRPDLSVSGTIKIDNLWCYIGNRDPKTQLGWYGSPAQPCRIFRDFIHLITRSFSPVLSNIGCMGTNAYGLLALLSLLLSAPRIALRFLTVAGRRNRRISRPIQAKNCGRRICHSGGQAQPSQRFAPAQPASTLFSYQNATPTKRQHMLTPLPLCRPLP